MITVDDTMTRMRTDDIQASYQECRNSTKEHAKAFYFASFALPKDKRYAAYSVYAFCRRADNLVDALHDRNDAHRVQAAIDAMRQELDRAYEDVAPGASGLPALRNTVSRFSIPKEYFVELLRGVEMDLRYDRYATFEELREYCYRVASVVGLTMTRILGTTDDAALAPAADLGTAMQLTNILRDVGEDFRMGRIYLPLEDLDRFRYREEDLARGMVNENFVELMRFQSERALEYYRRAEAGIPLLAGAGAQRTVRIMARTYRRILDKIRDNRYDVFTRRAFVPFPEKLIIAAGSFIPGPGERAPVHGEQSGVHHVEMRRDESSSWTEIRS